QALALVRHQRDVDSRIAMAEGGVHRREKRRAAETRESQAERSPLQAAQAIELGEEVGALREQVQGARIDELPRGRELAAAADAIEERHAELLLELLHRLADGWLARERGLRCPREAALAHDFGKEAQPAQVEVHAYL